MTMIIGGKPVPFQLVFKNRKTVRFEVSPGGELKIQAPLGISMEQLQSLAQKRADWILSRLQLAIQTPPPETTKPIPSDLPWQGKTLPLRLIADDGVPHMALTLEKEAFLLRHNPFFPAERLRFEARPRIEAWYREKARQEVCESISFFQHKHPDGLRVFQVNQVRIKDQKTRWGSCSGKRNLNFNWRLVLAPPEILEYVVAHELCHLVQPNHSTAFWKWVGQLLPDYAVRRKWLKKNGHLLLF